ncbi:hypothetical protein AVDCRST_MAG94-3189 [uncultured Leptolyngbya sp.]|uniref:Uncharacterized protein n=1 Tax=uncultured Leptolyngbya sp. TaxID=332963 RepID=A0A6J4MHI1_9CYAN|nr:hypothetical protein AVDCRST_MAG94-3189 [uncultured Leptolyngbya sp.]
MEQEQLNELMIDYEKYCTGDREDSARVELNVRGYYINRQSTKR